MYLLEKLNRRRKFNTDFAWPGTYLQRRRPRETQWRSGSCLRQVVRRTRRSVLLESQVRVRMCVQDEYVSCRRRERNDITSSAGHYLYDELDKNVGVPRAIQTCLRTLSWDTFHTWSKRFRGFPALSLVFPSQTFFPRCRQLTMRYTYYSIIVIIIITCRLFVHQHTLTACCKTTITSMHSGDFPRIGQTARVHSATYATHGHGNNAN